MSDSAPPPPPPENPAGATPPPPPPMPMPAAAPPPPMGALGARPGELLDRFLAKLIDFVILFVVNLIISVVILGAIFSTGGNALGMGGSYGFSIVSGLITAAIYVGYFSFMESSRGATVGKQVMKLHVEGPTGGKPTMEQAVRRNGWLAYPALAIIPILGPLLGSLLALVAVIMIAVQINGDTAKRQSFMDKFAGGTEVVKVG